MENGLIVVTELNALEIFTGNGLDAILEKIKEKVDEHIPDVSTASGRKEIASLARRVSSSKVILDDLGKSLVTEWKQKAKLVDVERKKARDELDRLRDFARQPLTDYEAAAQAKLEAERLAHEREEQERDAYAEHDLRERERAVREKEAELSRQQALVEAERLESERQERERRIAEEAAENARRIAEEAARADRARELEAEAQRKRLAEEKEAARVANIDHRARIEKETIESIEACLDGEVLTSPELALRILCCIREGSIKHVTINY